MSSHRSPAPHPLLLPKSAARKDLLSAADSSYVPALQQKRAFRAVRQGCPQPAPAAASIPGACGSSALAAVCLSLCQLAMQSVAVHTCAHLKTHTAVSPLLFMLAIVVCVLVQRLKK